MNTLILFVALAAHAAAPKAELAPATVASAAVAANPIASEVIPVPAAVAANLTAPDVIPAPAAIAGRVCVFPQPVDAAECSVTALLRTRFLSGPWSVERRLEAARRTGRLIVPYLCWNIVFVLFYLACGHFFPRVSARVASFGLATLLEVHRLANRWLPRLILLFDGSLSAVR